ncbi:unnamed protein product [Cylindrotheca closterium]|uniref:Uncharacterized protein n=1 Tax=Cylindrotheca closterium TaxID=2856 RepID=A0AAD2FJV8_9STRA|nr:unnamed protein product [Cylindrotheca closterium]
MSENQWYFFAGGDRYAPPNVSHLLIASNVLDIPSSLCAGNQCLREVRFQPNSVCRGIGASAFYDCGSLELVELSPTVRLVGFMAFQQCPRLQVVTMDSNKNNNKNAMMNHQPQAITTRRKFGLGFQCFKNASSLTEVSIIEGIRSVSEACFEGCSSLRQISLPNTVEHLMKKAFKSCTNLEITILNEGLKSISDEAFCHCEKLQTIPIPWSVERIGTRAFASCTTLENVEIIGLDYRLKTIDEEAFAHCENLRAVPIPNSVERISSRAFENCTMLYSVEFKNGSHLWIGDDIFKGCSNLIWIVVSYSTYKRHYNRFHLLAEAFDRPAIDDDSRRNQNKTVLKMAADRFDSLQNHRTTYTTARHDHDDNIEIAKLDKTIQMYHREQEGILPKTKFVTGTTDINLFHIMASSSFPRHNLFHERLDSLNLGLLFEQDKIGLSPLMLLAENPSAEAQDLLLSLIPKLVAYFQASASERMATISISTP